MSIDQTFTPGVDSAIHTIGNVNLMAISFIMPQNNTKLKPYGGKRIANYYYWMN